MDYTARAVLERLTQRERFAYGAALPPEPSVRYELKWLEQQQDPVSRGRAPCPLVFLTAGRFATLPQGV